jgi:hypothetical protein
MMHRDRRGQTKHIGTKPSDATTNTTNRITVTNRIDLDLWKEVKHQAVTEGRAITYILEEALRDYLEKKTPLKGADR